MPSKTWTNTADMTALEHCSVASGSAVAGNYTFADDDTATGIDDWTQVPGSAGGSINHNTGTGVVEITGPSSQQGLTATTGSMADTPYIKLAGAVDGDFDVRMKIEFPTDAESGFGGCVFRIDDANCVMVYRFLNSGSWYTRTAKRVDGTRTFTTDEETTNQDATVWLRCVRSTNDFTGYISSDGESWTTLGTVTNAFASTMDVCAGWDYRNSQTTMDVQEVEVVSGFDLTARVQVHDSGLDYADNGAGMGADLSTYAQTLTNGTLGKVKLFFSDNSGATPSYTDYASVAAVQAVGNQAYRYGWQQVEWTTSTGQSSFDEASYGIYSIDTTPPAVPTAAKFSQFENDNFALIWTEPDDADFSHCELRRDIDGATRYLDNVGGAATWAESASDPFTFADGDGTADCPNSNYIDEDVTGDPTYYVRSVDALGNASAWTVFAEGASSVEAPPTPTLSVSDDGNGSTATAVVSGSAAGATNTVRVAPWGSTTWTDAGERTGDGSLSLSLSVGRYAAFCRSSGGGGDAASTPVFFTIADTTASPAGIREYVRGLLCADADLASLLATSDAVYTERPPVAASYPCIVMETDIRPDGDYDASGVFDIDLSLTVLAPSGGSAAAILDRARRLLDGETFESGGWTVRRTAHAGGRRSACELRTVSGLPVEEWTSVYRIRAFRDDA